MKRYQVAAVAALGGAMVTATLIVGLGVDGHSLSRDAALKHDATAVQPGGSVGAGLPGQPSMSSAPSAVGDSAGIGKPPPPSAANAPRPPEPPAVQPESVAKVHVTSSGSIAKDKATLKVVTAHTDLTGQRELAWAADAGHAFGDARCTQNFQFTKQSNAGVRPTMLLCWRTSATKSVYIIAVDLKHRPSEKANVARLTAAWNAM